MKTFFKWQTINNIFQVDGEKYTGQGRSKKIARIEAAASALKSFIQFKDGTALNALKPIKNIDFTSDDHLENGNKLLLITIK